MSSDEKAVNKIYTAMLEVRVKDLTERRNELQEANNAYLERARKAEAWAVGQDEELKFWIDEAKKWADAFANKRIEAEMWQHEAHRLQRRGRMWVLIWGLTVLVGWLAFLWVRT